LHPVVKAYAEGQPPLLEALEKLEDRSPLAEALRKLLLGRELRTDVEEALAAAAAAGAEGEDPDLYLLFLVVWAAFAGRMRRYDEAGALLSRARSLVSPDTPAELRASLAQQEILQDERFRQIASQGTAPLEALKLLPEDSPRRWNTAMERAFHLAQRGRLCEFEAEFRKLAEAAGDDRSLQIDVARYLDYAECGRTAEAAELAVGIDTENPFVRRNLNGIVYAGALLELMAGTLVPEELADPASAEPVRQLRAVNWIHSTYHLLAGRNAEALDRARRQAATFSGLHSLFGFLSLCLVRAELAAGHVEAAARLMRRRAEARNSHYLDDFFLARVELLRGRPAAAAERFARLLAEVDRHDARGRLDFELRLARELSPGDVVELTRAAAAAAKPTETAPPSSAAEHADLSDPLGLLIGRSPAMRKVREEIKRCAPLDVPVLITGETGTGKELVARALHEMSWRRSMPFLAANCGAIAESLLESELFGHEKGAFTGASSARSGLLEEAGEGTLLLDEIGNVTPRLQVALLRVLESGEIRRVGASRSRKVSCRVVAATNAPLEELVERGAFRKDLYYRLKRIELRMPPLRERGDDALLLAGHYLERDRPPGQRVSMTDALRAALRAYGWPGNVRELRNEVERMRLMSSEALSYDVGDLSPTIRGEGKPPTAATGQQGAGEGGAAASADGAKAGERAPEIGRILAESRTRFRRLDRLRELFRQHGKLTRAEIARALGVSPKTATRDLKALVEEGFIDRVEPSASLRSRYFRLREGR
jgi:DNA-binding NtrC family response regulator